MFGLNLQFAVFSIVQQEWSVIDFWGGFMFIAKHWSIIRSFDVQACWDHKANSTSYRSLLLLGFDNRFGWPTSFRSSARSPYGSHLPILRKPYITRLLIVQRVPSRLHSTASPTWIAICDRYGRWSLIPICFASRFWSHAERLNFGILCHKLALHIFALEIVEEACSMLFLEQSSSLIPWCERVRPTDRSILVWMHAWMSSRPPRAYRVWSEYQWERRGSDLDFADALVGPGYSRSRVVARTWSQQGRRLCDEK